MATKTEGPLRKLIRHLQLGFSLGIASFLIGTPLTMRLMGTLLSMLDGNESTLLGTVARLFMLQFTSVAVAPVLGYAAGFFTDSPGALLAVLSVATVQTISLLIIGISMGMDAVLLPSNIGAAGLASVTGMLLTTLTIRVAQQQAKLREEIANREAHARAALANPTFTAPAPDTAPAPEAAKPAEAPKVEQPAEPVPPVAKAE